jgi:hypothetical protein
MMVSVKMLFLSFVGFQLDVFSLFFRVIFFIHKNKKHDISLTYSGQPPREIYVEASGQSDNVVVTTTTATSESEQSLLFPSARRVADDPKTKIFTFEGLTPVSTADDTREDAIVADLLPDHENRVARDDNFIVSSPLTSDLSLDKDHNDDTNYDVDNGQIVCSASSTVREKVAAWEKRVISWRSTDMYDVPFDEDPMRKNAGKIDNTVTLVAEIGDEIDMSKETITEIPLDEIFECEIQSGDGDNAETIERTTKVAQTDDSKFQEVEQANATCTNPVAPMTNLLGESDRAPVASMTNLLDEDEEPELHTAPSDENEPSETADIEKRDIPEHEGNDSTLGATTSLVESFGCPDAICTQVSKLWQ